MKNYASFLIPGLIGLFLFRLTWIPIRKTWQLAVHSAAGLAGLVLCNCLSGITGLVFPINAVTVLMAGFGGLPGIALLAILEML